MFKFWRWYQNCMQVHPVKTQIISSGFIWGLGDVLAQTVTYTTTPLSPGKTNQDDEPEELKINWKRASATSLFGFAFVGPIGHFWYEGLDQFMKKRMGMKPRSVGFVAGKVALDGIIFGPLDLVVFFSYMGMCRGRTVSQIKEDVKRDFLPALALEGGLWPLLQVANFRFVPVRYQLLYVNLFCLLDSCFLSWLDQQEDAPWKHRLIAYVSSLKDRV